MENEITLQPTAFEIDMTSIQGLSKVFYESGIFKDIKSEAQAIVKIYAGREIGLSPIESMMGLYIVDSVLAATAKVICSLIKKSKTCDYVIEKLDNEECVISFLRDSKEIGKSSFTMKDAARAGLVNKENWRNYPRNMLFARSIANGARWYTPDVYCGYAKEELEGIEINNVVNNVVTIDKNGEVKKNGEQTI